MWTISSAVFFSRFFSQNTWTSEIKYIYIYHTLQIYYMAYDENISFKHWKYGTVPLSLLMVFIVMIFIVSPWKHREKTFPSYFVIYYFCFTYKSTTNTCWSTLSMGGKCVIANTLFLHARKHSIHISFHLSKTATLFCTSYGVQFNWE